MRYLIQSPQGAYELIVRPIAYTPPDSSTPIMIQQCTITGTGIVVGAPTKQAAYDLARKAARLIPLDQATSDRVLSEVKI